MMLPSTASSTWKEQTASSNAENRKIKARYVVRTLYMTVLVAMSVLLVTYDVSTERKVKTLLLKAATIGSKKAIDRKLSIDFGDGSCQWTQAVSMPDDSDPYFTLITSYPGSGMRFFWQQTEGMTGFKVGDEFSFNGETNAGVMKSHYPHPEGTWDLEHDIDQTVLLVRNPRWALISYHAIIWELDFAYDKAKSREMLEENPIFTRRAPVTEWQKWRDFYFESELDLWKKHIDFWMSNGKQYWEQLDFERNGDYPFRFNEEQLESEEQDPVCVDMDCKPKSIIVYELLRQEETGPHELEKLAGVLRGKGSMTDMVSDEALPCVWSGTIENVEYTDGKGRPGNRNLFKYTLEQMEALVDTIDTLRAKYRTGIWENDDRAHELIRALDIYHNKNTLELDAMISNPPPPVPHSPHYRENLQKFFTEKGKLGRYSRPIVEKLPAYWSKARSHFDDTDSQPIE